MKPALLLPVAVALLLAGSVVSWWRVSGSYQRSEPQIAVGLLMIQQCEVPDPAAEDPDPACTFTDGDPTLLGTVRHWTFLIGLVAAAILIGLIAAPIGSRLRSGLANAAVVASAAALVMGLALLCGLVYVGVELEKGYPGLGGPLFLTGAILALRTTRIYAAGEPPA